MRVYKFLSASALAMILPTPAFAQEAPNPAEPVAGQECVPGDTRAQCVDPTSSEEVIVTGSRIPFRRSIDAAVPIASVSAQELLGARGDISLGDALNQLPQLRSTFSQANSTGSIGTAGLNLSDLRGLGTARTLTLVNGRRVVTAVPGSYTPDVNTIPFDLVEAVDIVTGGNSAIYGSDAVAGVINFRLRRDFEGFRVRGQGGITSYGDRGSYLVTGIAGANFFEDRLNVTVSGEYSRANPLFFNDRDYLGAFTGQPGWINSQITTAPNRNFDGIPNTTFVDPGARFYTRSLGGTVLTECPAAVAGDAAVTARRNLVCTGLNTPTGGRLAFNYVFRPDGSLVRDDQITDARSQGSSVIGGLGATGIEDAMLVPGLDRYVTNVVISGNFSPAFQPFLEGTFARIDATQQSTQPTFNGNLLSDSVSINNPFLTPQARATLAQILTPGALTFRSARFNNDFGTRAEFHRRDTWRLVGGVAGQITDGIRYEVAGNYGRTENRYNTGGNVLLDNYTRAQNAVLAPTSFSGSNFALNSQGQRVICGVNAATNVDPNCVPLNLFGFGAPDQRALDYILYTSNRSQWAEQINATAFVAGDTRRWFSLPAGPIGFSLGGEYRREDAFSGQDPITSAGLTFLNPASTFDPPAVNIWEAFGELRVPLLAERPFFHELSAEGAGRVSDYGGTTGSVWAWNAGLVYAPVPDLRLRATYSRSVRAPNLSNLFATAAQTFQNGLTDPCDQPGGPNANNNIEANPNRAANCAAAGIPTTITFVDNSGQTVTRPWTNVPGSGVPGVNSGNPNLTPEVGNSFTVGGILTPRFLQGFTLKVDYYNIRVDNVISGLSGQAIINRCYDDPGGLSNPFCANVFRRASASAVDNFTFLGQTNRTIDQTNFAFNRAGDGVSFINAPFNFAQLKTRGIDFEGAYRHEFTEDVRLTLRVLASYVNDRLQYTYITEPSRYDRLEGTLGDPKWAGQFTANLETAPAYINYNLRYVGRQIVSGLSYETFFPLQGRPPLNPDARPFIWNDAVWYHNIRVGVRASEEHEFYFGVDNVFNELPPYEYTGIGADAIYPNTGRFLYAGFISRF